MRPGLEALLHPFAEARFMREHWPAHHLVVHGELARLAPLASLPELAHVRALLEVWRGTLLANLPDSKDEHAAISVGSVEAQRLYENGMALVFSNVERQVPGLAEWVEALRQDLGLPREVDGRCIVYANPTSEVVVPHFDANANFVLQLRGVKRWRVAPNTWVEDPIDRYAINMKTVPRRLSRYATAPAPTEMPPGAPVIDLRPGSLLFVPRGAWHATESLEEALSLNFTFSQPTWTDVVVAAIRKRLERQSPWRGLADGIHAARPDARAAAAARLQAMFGRLTEDLGALDARELIHQSYFEGCYRLTPGLQIQVEGANASVRAPDGSVTAIQIDDDYADVLPWIAERSEPFSRREFAARFPRLADRAVLEFLTEAGLLELMP